MDGWLRWDWIVRTGLFSLYRREAEQKKQRDLPGNLEREEDESRAVQYLLLEKPAVPLNATVGQNHEGGRVLSPVYFITFPNEMNSTYYVSSKLLTTVS